LINEALAQSRPAAEVESADGTAQEREQGGRTAEAEPEA